MADVKSSPEKNLSILNDPPRIECYAGLLHELFEQSVENHGDAVALSFVKDIASPPEDYTYKEVDRIANDLAWQLAEKGQHGRIIPVILPQCVELYISILAILKSGNIYCPILPETDSERIEFICKDLEAEVVVTTSATKAKIPTAYTVFNVDLPGCKDRRPSRIDTRTTSLAYTMYTSGSTGTPKAVMISHRAATTSIRAHDELFKASNIGDAMLQFANSTFDISIFEIFSTWARGLKLLSAQRSILLSDLPNFIEKHHVAYLELTPSVAGLLPNKSDSRMTSIKLLITIGELLTKKVIQNWHGRLVNAYGPTEATLHASYSRIDDAESSPSDIGLPLDTCSLVILDPESTTVLPQGDIGELCIAGAQVADGYLHRSDLTTAAFISHPQFSGRLYRTGDLAKIVSGRVLFIGRKAGDTQVKINGQRVELGEIAHAIESDSRVSSCAVISHKSQLFAFVVLASSVQISAEFQPAGKLPFDVRPLIIVLEDMPTSTAGKRDNRKLTELAEQHMLTEAESSSHDDMGRKLNETEELVLSTVRSIVSGISSQTQSFRTFGVDSLTSIKIVMALLDKGVRITVFDVLDSDSVEELSKRASSVDEDSKQHSQTRFSLSEETLSSLRARHGEAFKFAKATDIQSSMLAASLSDSEGRLYYNHIQIKLKTQYPAAAIRSAWEALTEAHEILRTGFDANVPAQESCDFVQVIHPTINNSVEVMEIETGDLEAAFGQHRQSKTLSSQELLQPAINLQVFSYESEMYLSLMLHHALYDAWSLELMLAELSSRLSGDTVSIGPQYSTVAEEMSTYSSTTEEKKAYWTDYLRDVAAPRFPILAQYSVAGAEKQRTTKPFSMSLSEMDQACLDKGINPQVLGQSAWATLLSWITGERVVSMSITTSGRTHPVTDLDRTLGPFIATYPFVYHVDSACTISKGMHEVNQSNNSLSKHDMSYRDILRNSDNFQSPDTLFIYQKTGTDLASQHTFEIINQLDRLEFQVMITFDRVQDGMMLHLDADPSLIAPSAADRLLALLDSVSRSILTEEDSTFGDLQALQSDNLLSITNPNPEPMKTGRLDEIVEDMASKMPDQPALQFYDTYESSKTLTYKELNNAAMRLAKSVAEAQLLPDDIVAICLNKSLDMYVSMLAIHKLGCGYVALEPALPDERIKNILQITSCQHVLTDTENAPRFVDREVIITSEVLGHDQDDAHFKSRPTKGLAYVLMTSGTTGMPKACLVTHSNVLSNCDVLSRLYPHVQTDRMMQFTSYAFDVSVFEIFWTWYNGMCLVSTHRDLMLSNLTKALQDFRITHLNMTASAAALIESSNLPNIKCFITSGEPSTRSIIRDWGPSARYFNAYGPTETTNVCSARLVQSGDVYPSSIGPPFKNSSGFVLDENLKVLPLFSIGELYIGGAQVIRGYLGDDERTQKQFIQHQKYGRLYRTGDVVRILEDGTISIAGRIDSQVKLRGHRIELDEISHVIKALDIVDDAATILHEDSLASFVKLSSQGQEQRDSAIDAVKKRTLEALPAYMTPATVVILDQAIPLTSTYKIDTRKLIELLQSDAQNNSAVESGSERNKEWTDLSRRLGEIICGLANISTDDITPSTSIAQLGLDSISAIRISSAIRDAKLGQLNVSTIMKKGTPEGMADELSKSSQNGAHSQSTASWTKIARVIESLEDAVISDLELTKSEVEVILPCSSLQEGLLLETMKDDSITYVNHSILKLQSDIESARLQNACSLLVARNQMLRACFAYTSDSTVPCLQVILKSSNLAFETQHCETEPLTAVLQRWKADCKEKFTLQRPSGRFLEIYSSSGHYLIMSLHHSLFDGWSLSLLQQDLEQLYLHEKCAVRPQLQSLLPSIFEACLITDEQQKSWSAYLTDYQPFTFPILSNTNSEEQNIRCSPLSTSLEALNIFATQQSISILAILQGAWSLLLASIAGSEDVCFANVVSGRTIAVESIEEAVMPLFNVLPARVDTSKHKSIGSILAAFDRYNKGLLDNPHFPLRKALKAGNFAAGEEAFDTILILQRPQDVSKAEVIQSISDDGDSNYAVMLEFIPDSQAATMSLRVTARNSKVSSSNLDVLVQRIDDLLENILQADQTTNINDSLSKRELLSITAPAPPLKESEFLHSAFLRNSSTLSHTVAIEYIDDQDQAHTISYPELGTKSSTIATYLQNGGFEQGTPVVVMMSSAPDIFVAFLGVLRAGMVYTPLATDTPPERLSLILEELKPGMVLVDDTALEATIQKQYPDIPCKLTSGIAIEEQPCLESLSITPDDLAYVIYTSGSTGKPKAVAISHSAAVAAVESSRSLLRTKKTSKWLQFASITFDMSVYDMSIAFSFGITLCGAPKGTLLDSLAKTIQTLSVTHLDLTPSVAKTLRKEDLPCVEVLFCIGEKLSSAIIREWGTKCLNVYGPTEASMACTLHNVTEDSLASNIGHPFQHAQVAVFDKDEDRLLPISSVGELCIAGPQLSKGYLHNEEMTEKSFFKYNDIRYYRTGDLCRMLADKSLNYVDRKDGQTKLRGQRIELEEINTIVAQRRPEFKSVSTHVMRNKEQTADVLVCFVSKNANRTSSEPRINAIATLESEKILQEIAAFLPSYMIPNQILDIDYIPLSAAKKVDKRRLTSLWQSYDTATDHADEASLEEEPDTELEEIIRQTFSTISGTDKASITKKTSMQRLGLDSISAMQISTMLKRSNFKVSVVDILRHPTIERLATRIVSLQSADTDVNGKDAGSCKEYDALNKSLMSDSKEKLPMYACTPTQENMLAQFINTSGTAYYNHILFRLAEKTDCAKLRHAWLDTIKSNDVLRAGFATIDRHDCQYAMVIHPSEMSEQLWSHRDLSDGDVESAVSECIQGLSRDRLEDLTTPSFRLCLLQKGTEHLLLLSAHHALYDGQSLQLLHDQVIKTYNQASIPTLGRLDTSAGKLWTVYHDNHIQDESMSYWQKRLSQSLFVPFPNLNNLVDKDEQTTTRHWSSETSLVDIENLCKTAETSLSNVAMLTWAKILSSYTGEAGVTFGVVLSGRTGMDLEDALFPCLTTIPFTYILDKSCKDSLVEFDQLAVEALENQHVTLNKVKREDGSSLFDTLFVYQRQASDNMNNELWSLSRDYASVEVPLSIEVLPNEQTNELNFSMTYRPAQIPGVHAELILKQYNELLMQILQNPNVSILDIEENLPIDMLSILSPPSPVLDSPVSLLHNYVSHFAQLTPDAIAMEFAEDLESDATQWSYKDLDEKSNLLANFLIEEHQLGDDSPLAICFDKSPEAFISILATLKTGAPFCCLDPSAPIDRRAFIIDNCGAGAVLCGQAYAEELRSSTEVRVIVVDDLDAIGTNIQPVVKDQDDSSLCYILYTSGSTGTPKGCCLSHKSVVQAMESFKTQFCGRHSPDSRFLAFASLHFDVSILESYFSWSIGARVCAAPKDALLSDIPGAIKKFSITHLDLTPQLAMTLLPEDAESLQVFITGGEMLRSETVDHWGDTGVLFNFYGPTEATIGCTALRQVVKRAKPSNIGQQWTNCGSIVRSQLGKSKAAIRGAIGDLVISGYQVAKGYMKLPEATSKRFKYSAELDARTYDTGDLVRLLEVDLSFDFAGRADSQIKLRGQRIETGEIDSVLLKSSAGDLVEAVTLVMKHHSQQKDQLVSFIVYRSDHSPKDSTRVVETHDTLDEHFSSCKASLPTYMVPSYMVPLTRIDLTPTNKVDSKKISALYNEIDSADLITFAAQKSTRRTKTADRNIIQKIKSCLTDMTGVEDIGDNTSAFELGLDSVSIVGFVRKLKTAGFDHCSVATVMSTEDVLDLAYHLEEHDKKNNGKSIDTMQKQLKNFYEDNISSAVEELGISQADVEHLLPCTPLIEGLLVESIHQDAKLHYNKFDLTFSQPVDSGRLADAFDALINQTPILRSRFVVLSEGIAHVVLRESAKDSAITSADFPLRSKLVHLTHSNDSKHEHTIELHHALYDGQSLDLIIADLSRLYEDLSTPLDRPSFLPVVTEILAVDLDAAKDSWSEQLDAATALLPARRSEQVFESTLNSKTTLQELERCAQGFSCTPNVLCQAVWALTTYHLLGGDSVFGLVVAGRNMAVDDAAQIVYPSFNTLPIYIETSKVTKFQDLIRALQQFYGKALAFEHMPLREIKKVLRIPSDVPLVDTVFVYQKQEQTTSSEVFKISDRESEASSGFAIALDVTTTVNSGTTITAKIKDIGIEARNLTSCFELALQTLIQGTPLQEVTDQILGHPLITEKDIKLESWRRSASRKTNDAELQPLSEVAQKVRQVVSDLVELPENEIDPEESFFVLGLDSVDIIKLSARLKQKSQLNFSVSQIMQNATVIALGSLASSSDDASSTTASTIPEEFAADVSNAIHIDYSFEDIMPVSPIQSGILTMSGSSDDDTSLYLNHTLVRLVPEVKAAQIVDAWQKLIDLNSILRTTFESVSDSDLSVPCHFVQVIRPAERPFDIDLQHITEDDLLNRFSQHQQRALNSSSERGTVPLFLQLYQTDKCLYHAISIHHALYDGASLDMLFHDLQNIIRGQQSVERPPYKLLIEHILKTPSSRAALFWAQYLKDCKPKLVATSTTTDSDKYELQSTSSISQLRQVAKTLGVSLQALMQGVFALYLMETLNESDVLFGTIQAGRSFVQDAELILGPCMNTLPIRAQVLKDTTFATLAKDLHQANLSMIDHIHSPLSQVQKQIGKGPLFETLFVFQSQDDAAEKLDIWTPVVENSSVEFPLAVECSTSAQDIRWTVAAHKGQERSVEEIAHRIDELLGQLVEKVDELISTSTPEIFENDNVHSSSESASSEDEEDGYLVVHQDEAAILELLSAMTKIDIAEISRKTSIFSMGLDSISAIELSKKLKTKGFKLSVGEILRNPTVKDMHKVLALKSSTPIPEQKRDSRQESASLLSSEDRKNVAKQLEVTTEKIETIMPATAAQIYFLSAWKATKGARFMSNFAFKIDKDMDHDAIAQRWKDLCASHSILRTAFVASSDSQQVLQCVLKDAPDSLTRLSMDEQDHEQSLLGFFKGDSFEPPKLTQSPVYVTIINGTKGSEGLLVLSIHHALYDAISLPMIVDTLSGKSCNDSELFFTQFAEDVRPEAKDSVSYWTTYLKDARPFILAPQNQSADSGKREQLDYFSGGESRSVDVLETLSSRLSVTIQSILLVAIAKALAQYDDRGDAVLGLYSSGRSLDMDGIERMMGPTVNIVPVRVDEIKKEDPTKIIAAVHGALIEMNGFAQQVPVNEILGATGWKERRGLVDVAVNILPRRSTATTSDDDEPALRDYGRPSAACIEAIRERYATDVEQHPSSIDSFTDLDCVDPVLDLEVEIVDGQVNFGVFCGAHVLSERQAEGLVDRVWKFIESV